MSERLYAGLSFEQAVLKYSDSVTAVCVMRLKNYADAEDCYQNTFGKLFRKSPEFQSEEHLKAWLLRVAINECASLQRKIRFHIPLEDVFDQPAYEDVSDSDISRALMEVPVKYRQVLYLHYCEQYKVNEISQILGIKPNTVKSLLKRGRDILRKAYGGDAG